jgi:hypothetical protein
MITSTTSAAPRSQGGSRGATPATSVHVLRVKFSPTQVSAPLLTESGHPVTLPRGAMVIGVVGGGGATGGSDPTVHIGHATDADAFVVDLPADLPSVRDSTLLGDESPAPLATNVELYGGVGASAATGGEVTAWIEFMLNDGGGFP